MNKILITCLFTIIFTGVSRTQDYTNNTAEYISWAILQAVPSPVLIQDSNDKDARVLFGLRWQIIPVNISFRANKYISPLQFFKINPARKFTGSAELFIQPEVTLSGFKYATLNSGGLSAGSRITIPVSGGGQNVSVSIGGKYNYRKDYSGGSDHYWGIETGVYFIYGILGLQFNYNFDKRTKYNIGFYFKYF